MVCECAERTADAEVVGVDRLAVDLELLAFDPEVGDPVLAATVGASGDVKFQVLIEAGQAVVEFFDQPARKALRFGDGELAELGAAAGNGPRKNGDAANGKSDGGEFFGESLGILLRHVDDEQVLHVRGAQVAVSKTFREFGGSLHLIGADAAAQDSGADIAETILLLRMDADVVAIEVVREALRVLRDRDWKPRRCSSLVLEALRRPAVAKEQKLQSRAFAMLAQVGRNRGRVPRSLDDRHDLIPAHERVQTSGEIRIG